MFEVIDLLQQLIRDMALIKGYIQSVTKNKLDNFKDVWIDGQDVMQTLHLSKRTLQALRDNGTLPYSRINGKFYYKVSDIENLLESNYAKAKPTDNGTK
jgi:Helix-turn-helix domain